MTISVTLVALRMSTFASVHMKSVAKLEQLPTKKVEYDILQILFQNIDRSRQHKKAFQGDIDANKIISSWENTLYYTEKTTTDSKY